MRGQRAPEGGATPSCLQIHVPSREGSRRGEGRRAHTSRTALRQTVWRAPSRSGSQPCSRSVARDPAASRGELDGHRLGVTTAAGRLATFFSVRATYLSPLRRSSRASSTVAHTRRPPAIRPGCAIVQPVLVGREDRRESQRLAHALSKQRPIRHARCPKGACPLRASIGRWRRRVRHRFEPLSTREAQVPLRECGAPGTRVLSYTWRPARRNFRTPSPRQNRPSAPDVTNSAAGSRRRCPRRRG